MSNLFDFDPREDDEEGSDFDPFETSSDDEEYLPEPDNEPQQHETTCSEPKEFVLSKDGKYCYYFEPPPQLPNKSNASFALHETPGRTLFASSRCTDILSSFLLFMEPIEKTIVEMTNLYGSRKYKELWLPVDIASLRAYYGLLILACVYRSHGQCINELWDDQTGPPIFRATMTLKKFKLINECIRFDDKEQRKGIRSRDKLAPIRNVYDKWVNRLKMCYTVGKNVTVEEQLVPFRGRCPFTEYIPSKPHKYSIKIWCLCDASTYYAWNLEVYTGRDRNCKAEVNQGQRVVLTLSNQLSCRNITTDNFFTSRQLALELKKKQNNTMISYVPKKNRFVTLFSTLHDQKSVANDEQKKPEIIRFYNATKGGVDSLDKLVGTYRCKRKVNRWPLALFCNILDTSAYNSFVIFIHLNADWKYEKKKYRRRLYLVELGKQLVTSYIANRKTRPRTPNANTVIDEIQNISSRSSSPTTSTSAAPTSTTNASRKSNLPNSQKLTHAPSAGKRSRCAHCEYKNNKNLYSNRCDKCITYVCNAHHFKLCTNCIDKL
ncbi:piggyBac transposable element-derived protein 4-like [Hermetia illucens]|uniref:piggyBac transposable element-derived protein 4-like n=1 Tax=Hermetia illucens TaxID=343691 RepID=UPI0018CC037A|nr:piggyBac transposable element-derived protein 4-like [Hermetia illucens]